MAKIPIDFDLRIRLIPEHVSDLPEEAPFPRRHYERTANDAWALLVYFERNLKRVDVYPAASERHLNRLMGMVLLNLVEAFERFLKELAAHCIDQIGILILDDRLDIFNLKGSTFASHFSGGSLGQSLCESSTWVDCDQVNERFKRILADPFDAKKGAFYVFPNYSQNPERLRARHQIVSIIWQLRHSIVHNAAVLTRSDALKLRLLTKRPVDAPRVLQPNRGDVWYVKLFLDETVDMINTEVGARLAALLTHLYASDTGLFNPETKAQEIADSFGIPITINNFVKSPS